MPNDQWEFNQHSLVPGQSNHISALSFSSLEENQVKKVSPTVRYTKQKPSLLHGPRQGDSVSITPNSRLIDRYNQIYDEFRFLDEPETPSHTSSRPIISNESAQQFENATLEPGLARKFDNRMSCRFWAFGLLALVQLSCAIGLIVVSILRCHKFYSDGLWTSRDEELLELDETQVTRTNMDIMRLKSGFSLFLPSVFQLFCALCAFWPFFGSAKFSFQILHIVFSMISIFFWFSSVEEVCYELNLYYFNIDTSADYKSNMYTIYLVLLALGFFEAIILPTLTMIFTCRLITFNLHHTKSSTNTVLAIGTSLMSATVLFFAAYSTSRNLNLGNIHSKPSVFYGLGLRETIISVHIVFCSLIYFFSSVYRDYGLSIASCLLQSINILSLGNYIFNSTRLLSVVYDILILVKSEIQTSTSAFNLPVAYPSVILLYSFQIILLILLCAQLFLTVFSISKGTIYYPSSSMVTPAESTLTNLPLVQERTTF